MQFNPAVPIGRFENIIVEMPTKPIQVLDGIVGRIRTFVVAIFDSIKSLFYSAVTCSVFSYTVAFVRNTKFDLHSNPFIIISFDGGGVRGKVSLAVAKIIEQELQKVKKDAQIKDAADLIAGTSTGAIIGGGLAQGLTAVQLDGYYDTFAKTVFSTSLLHKIRSLWGAVASKYTSIGPLLRTIIEDKPLSSSLAKNLIITAVDVDTAKPVIFDNTMSDVTVTEAIEASAAAPTYFPSKIIKGKNLMDGGVENNNPIEHAVRRALELLPKDRPILAFSVGTGRVRHNVEGTPKVVNKGYLHWASELIDDEFTIQERQTNENMNSLVALDARVSYVRFQVDLPNADMARLDNASLKNMELLGELGTHGFMDFLNKGGRERVIEPMLSKLSE